VIAVPQHVPQHVAIIMDGNGRWASQRNLPKIMGHRAGIGSVRAVTEECARRGIKALTLYSFSTENWKRPKEEVDRLMVLLEESIENEWKRLHDNGIRFNAIGDLDSLPRTLFEKIRRVMDLTSKNSAMTLTLALNYGGRQELLYAARRLCEKAVKNGADPASFRTEDLGGLLYTSDLPELELIIRTSGEKRLSNFLLWQAAYAELYFTDVHWPDFRKDELGMALEDFSQRQRRFGG
jgi:undecaprenyl diphosphate synthase